MRQPSFTKTGPGRRSAHRNKRLDSFLAAAKEAIRLAKDTRDSGKSPSGLAWLITGRGGYHAVWHDDHLSHRKGVVILRPKYGSEKSRYTPGPVTARASLD